MHVFYLPSIFLNVFLAYIRGTFVIYVRMGQPSFILVQIIVIMIENLCHVSIRLHTVFLKYKVRITKFQNLGKNIIQCQGQHKGNYMKSTEIMLHSTLTLHTIKIVIMFEHVKNPTIQ